MTDVGTEAFHCGYALTKVHIGKNVKFQDIDTDDHDRSYTFFIGGALTTIEVDPENPYYTVQDNVLFSKDMTELLNFSSGRSGKYTIPGTVKKIHADAFEIADKLTEVVIPEGVEEMERTVFDGCMELKTIYWPRSLKTVGFHALLECRGLSDIYYAGSEEEWNAINFYEGHYLLALQWTYSEVTVHYNYELPLDPGNVNGQGGIDATDVQCLMDYLLGMGELTENQLKAADFNQDGVVDVYDVQALYLYLTQQGS